MIPYKDVNPTRRFPAVTVALIIANAAVFIAKLLLGSYFYDVVVQFGVVPIRYFYEGIEMTGGDIHAFTLLERLLPPFTYMFLHANWMHIIVNMLYLWVFGDNIEDRMGRVRFLVFYLLAGLAAAAAHVIANPDSAGPMIGASGAVAGVLGAYLMLYPKVKVRVAIPLFILIPIGELPAYVVLGFWFLLQLLQGWSSLGVDVLQSDAVAWWAHIGGFAFGIVFVHVFKKRDENPMLPEQSLMKL